MVKFLFLQSSQEDVSEQIGFVFKDMSFVIGFHLFCRDFSFSLTEHRLILNNAIHRRNGK